MGDVLEPLVERPAVGALVALIHEVRNTFGGRHSYVMAADRVGRDVRHACDKAFFVSPFMPMGLRYEFQVAPPGETVAVAIRVVGPDGPVLRAALAGKRRPFTNGALARAAVTVPFVALKTTAAIHWEAVRLIAKGARWRGPPKPSPAAPAADAL